MASTAEEVFTSQKLSVNYPKYIVGDKNVS